MDVHITFQPSHLMPRTSLRKEYLEFLSDAALTVLQVSYDNALSTDTESSDSPSDSWTDLSRSSSPMLITPPTPLTPIMGSQMSLDSTEASTEDGDLLDKDLL